MLLQQIQRLGARGWDDQSSDVSFTGYRSPCKHTSAFLYGVLEKYHPRGWDPNLNTQLGTSIHPSLLPGRGHIQLTTSCSRLHAFFLHHEMNPLSFEPKQISLLLLLPVRCLVTVRNVTQMGSDEFVSIRQIAVKTYILLLLETGARLNRIVI